MNRPICTSSSLCSFMHRLSIRQSIYSNSSRITHLTLLIPVHYVGRACSCCPMVVYDIVPRCRHSLRLLLLTCGRGHMCCIRSILAFGLSVQVLYCPSNSLPLSSWRDHGPRTRQNPCPMICSLSSMIIPSPHGSESFAKRTA